MAQQLPLPPDVIYLDIEEAKPFHPTEYDFEIGGYDEFQMKAEMIAAKQQAERQQRHHRRSKLW